MTQFNPKQWCGATPPSQMALLYLLHCNTMQPPLHCNTMQPTQGHAGDKIGKNKSKIIQLQQKQWQCPCCKTPIESEQVLPLIVFVVKHSSSAKSLANILEIQTKVPDDFLCICTQMNFEHFKVARGLYTNAF